MENNANIPSLVNLPIGTVLKIQDFIIERKYGLDNIIIEDTNGNKYCGGWFLLDQKDKIQKGKSLVRLDGPCCPKVGNKNVKQMSCVVFQEGEWWHSVNPKTLKSKTPFVPKTDGVWVPLGNMVVYKESGSEEIHKMRKDYRYKQLVKQNPNGGSLTSDKEEITPTPTESPQVRKARESVQRQEIRERKAQHQEEIFARKEKILARKEEILARKEKVLARKEELSVLRLAEFEKKSVETFKKQLVQHVTSVRGTTNVKNVPNGRYVILSVVIRSRKAYNADLNMEYDKKFYVVVLHPTDKRHNITNLTLVQESNLMKLVNTNGGYKKITTGSTVFLPESGKEVTFSLCNGKVVE